ncbi:NADH-quinone oxidoreductase subunit J family protein [Phorcysia thermohydrogeniphila]|uniref:NADH-quinone oxidoreductase subunit J n=1 Tax=Phorcysia thermohydrogeniphila TaxID=936138 RepID=A0A4R1GB26_9BACT|nr:NADH-quinone oxidoreductase subunit J [Phorcysia thermohydrogeniphila]TCK03923.1 NADH dehydrogenase subunit J [Phorcysia thermohydrogeniphila]
MSGNVYFWIIYAIIVASAILALEVSSLLWAAISFVVLLSEIALVYFGLGMPVLGGVQLAIYAGGVTILVLFAIMMIGESYQKPSGKAVVAILVSVFLTVFGTFLSFLSAVDTLPYKVYSTEKLGTVFVEKYSFFTIVLGFIVAAILYMANAIITKKREAK